MAVGGPLGNHQLKMYERELLAAKEQLEGAVCKQKLALRSIDFGLIYIDRNYLVQWEETGNIKIWFPDAIILPALFATGLRGREPNRAENVLFGRLSVPVRS